MASLKHHTVSQLLNQQRVFISYMYMYVHYILSPRAMGVIVLLKSCLKYYVVSLSTCTCTYNYVYG